MPSPTAFITGANRGIGREIARQLAARGLRVAVGARSRAEEAARAVGAELGVELDVRFAPSCESAAARVGEAFGGLNVLVNNAAILLDEGREITDIDEAILWETLETNTLGPFRVTRAFWPLLREGARVVNLSSGGGQLSVDPDWLAPAYCVSKTALNMLTRQFALAGRDRRIAVNSLCPGWVRTDMGGPSARRSVEEGADTAVWLALDAPAGATGAFYRDRKPIPW